MAISLYFSSTLCWAQCSAPNQQQLTKYPTPEGGRSSGPAPSYRMSGAATEAQRVHLAWWHTPRRWGGWSGSRVLTLNLYLPP